MAREHPEGARPRPGDEFSPGRFLLDSLVWWPRTPVLRILAGLLSVVGLAGVLASSVAAVLEHHQVQALERRGVTVSGHVARVQEQRGYQLAVVAFRTASGRAVLTRGLDLDLEGPVVVGRPVRVIYDPALPQKARLPRDVNGASTETDVTVAGLWLVLAAVQGARTVHGPPRRKYPVGTGTT